MSSEAPAPETVTVSQCAICQALRVGVNACVFCGSKAVLFSLPYRADVAARGDVEAIIELIGKHAASPRGIASVDVQDFARILIAEIAMFATTDIEDSDE